MLVHRIVAQLGHKPWFAKLGKTIVAPTDRLIGKLTRGKVVTAGLLPGLMLTTTGRKSGREFTQPLAYFPDGDGFILIASNWGQEHHPSWSANLIANPQATVELKGERFGVHADLASGAERERLWAIALKRWPAYDTYAKRAAGRTIRVFRLRRTD